jgi:hypothetical protein
MEAKELRIGNWVLINDTPNIIRGGGIAAIEAGYFKMPLCPIPLTPEILVKAGFAKYQWMDGYFIKTKFGDLMIQFLTHRVYLYFTNVGGDSQGMKMRGKRYVGNINTTQNITYLHQLQNLYFALTGEELEINFAPVKPEFPKDRIGQWKGGA